MNLIADATVSDVEALRVSHRDLASLSVEELRTELWLLNGEISRRVSCRIRKGAVTLPNGDYLETLDWLFRRRDRVEAEFRRRRGRR